MKRDLRSRAFGTTNRVAKPLNRSVKQSRQEEKLLNGDATNAVGPFRYQFFVQ